MVTADGDGAVGVGPVIGAAFVPAEVGAPVTGGLLPIGGSGCPFVPGRAWFSGLLVAAEAGGVVGVGATVVVGADVGADLLLAAPVPAALPAGGKMGCALDTGGGCFEGLFGVGVEGATCVCDDAGLPVSWGLSGAAGGLGVTAAFVATEGGSEGANSAAAPAPATPAAITPPTPGDFAGAGPVFCDGDADAGTVEIVCV